MPLLLVLDDPINSHEIFLEGDTVYYPPPGLPDEPPVEDIDSPPVPVDLPPDSRDDFNREIIYDLELDAWTLYDFSHNDANPDLPRVHDYVPIPSYVRVDAEGNIRVDRTINDRIENFKFLATGLAHISMAEYRDVGFMDWRVVDGVGYNYPSYIITGPITLDNFSLYKQANYVTTYLWKTEKIEIDGTYQLESGATLQGIWDYHADPMAGPRWTREFPIYKYMRHLTSTPSSFIVTKNKLRGRGRSLILVFRSVPGKDMRILGWHLPITQMEVV